MDCSTLGFPVQHRLLEFAQTHVHWVDDATQTSHPLSPPFPPALNLSQHQGLFHLRKWKLRATPLVGSSTAPCTYGPYTKRVDVLSKSRGFSGGSEGKESACSAGDWIYSLGWEDPLEEHMATHSSILAWRIPMDRVAW